ncbi:vitamin K epoxide reductase family protein [Allonocardiopsis opalescens]|uniref:Putative membrane protein n=1 Tax=Allonocardiopsis opalescens TaxID=1144618 RepID=A0A2T0QF85_9ACTN|nr:vitamin K epoxide reductase family protein [Allonocardiopsis opalescens]PRY02578.1 putative membrane protein [Allonocardiopsis opalescens]
MHDQLERSAPGPDAGETPSGVGRFIPWLLAVGGAIGFTAAFILMYERIELLLDPDYVTSCTINAVLNCGNVMTSPQGEAFGFPNPLIGIGGFAIVTTIGMALLAKASFQRWYWLGMQAGMLFAVGFVHWLIFQTLYNIRALCPYCMVVWAVTIPMFWYVTVYNAERGHLPLPKALVRNHLPIVIVWLLGIAVLCLQAFVF